MVWYSHLFKNFPQFVVIHTAKGKAEKLKAKEKRKDVPSECKVPKNSKKR